jgi:hypothetical protein
VSQPHHVDLVLTHADGLDQDEAEPRGVHQVDAVGGRPREPAQRAARRHRADEDAGIESEIAHADAVAENRAARERRRRVDGEDADRATARAGHERQRAGQRALAGAGRAGDPDDLRAPGVGIEPRGQSFGPRAAGFNPREPARERPRRALDDLPRQRGDVRAHGLESYYGTA